MTRWIPLATLLVALLGGVAAVGVGMPAVEVHEAAEVSVEVETEEATASDASDARASPSGAGGATDALASKPLWVGEPLPPPPE